MSVTAKKLLGTSIALIFLLLSMWAFKEGSPACILFAIVYSILMMDVIESTKEN